MFGRFIRKPVKRCPSQPVQGSLLLELNEEDQDSNRLLSLGRDAMTTACAHMVLDLSKLRRATTATFALLVEAKAILRRRGGDVSIRGLHGQPMALCEVLKLKTLLLEGDRSPTMTMLAGLPVSR